MFQQINSFNRCCLQKTSIYLNFPKEACFQTFELYIQMRNDTLLYPLIITVLASHCVKAYSDPSFCTASTEFYDIVRLECSTCPANTARANDFTFCNCTTSFYDNPDVLGFNNSLSCLSASGSYTPATQIVPIFDIDGTKSAAPTITSCSNSYPDSTNTQCIPCGPSMTYSTTLSSCQCSTSGQYYVAGACYTNTNVSWTPTNPLSNANDYLAEINAVIGCGQYGVIQACNQLMNKCVQNGYASSDFFCKLLASYELTKSPASGLPVYSFSNQITDSISIYASSILGTNTTTIKNTLHFILAEYNADGSLHDIKSMDQSIFSCYLNSQDIVKFMSFGLSFYKTCTNPRKFTTSYFYDVYVIDANGKYTEVPVLISGTYYKRFLPSAYNSIELTLLSGPPLRVPYLTLSNQSPAVITTNSNAQSTTLSYLPFLAIFAVFIFIACILDFIRYLRYNPDQTNDPFYCCKAIFLFFVHIVKFVAVGIWLWVFVLSTYCFCFYKFQSTIYLILPNPSSDSSGLYTTFGAFFYIAFSFTIVAIIIMVFRIVNYTDYFLIDWEKEKELGKIGAGRNRREVSVWRKVLLVNELYELSMNRIISIEFVSLLSVLFLSGLNWIKLNSMIPSISELVTESTNTTTNSILSYFIITFVIFTIAIVQFILRHALKIWFPLPIEDFVDLCSVSNISIIIFDEALHGYYIHGMNPVGQSEGSLHQIESMFQKQAKSFGKSRSFQLQDVEHCQTFEVVFPFQVRQAFQVKYVSRFNQKLMGKNYSTSILSNPVPQILNDQDYKQLQEITNTMLETFKFYLEGIKNSNLNIRERTLFEKIINCPIDTTMMGKLPVFFKDLWYQFSSVMVSGHQFILLFNFINFVNIFYMAFKNIYFAFFVAFLFEKLFNFLIGFFIKRNISRNTLIDDKFFN